MKKVSTLISAAALLVASNIALAHPIAISGTEGNRIIVTSSNPVIATYQGNSADYNNTLYLDSPNGVITTKIFNNKTNSVGDTVNLGSFAVGTELIFRLHSITRNGAQNNFFSGDASRNPDGEAHARVQNNWKPNETLVSFEDLYNGKFLFNDLSFSFTNTKSVSEVPVPAAAWLFGSAILGLAGIRRKR